VEALDMKLHSLLLLIILAAIAAFSALNWSTFISPTNLSLGFTSVHMPLGLVMLGMLVLIVMLCLMFVVYIQPKRFWNPISTPRP
jgi:ribose/xylose/arabinose/galactoside ABC-type transport system permease subunit